MERSLEILKLALTELDVPISIKMLGERLLIQKAIYLAQSLGGVPLGYTYSWYVRGPYSPNLTKDYYALGTKLAEESEQSDKPLRLRDGVREQLKRVAVIMTPPKEVPLGRPEWAELFASVHYLSKIEHRDDEGVKARIIEAKPWLRAYTNEALQMLQGFSKANT